MLSSDTEIYKNSDRRSCDRKLMLFDLSIHGHHSSYIQHLIEYWCEEELSGTLDIVVSPKFLQAHSDVVNCVPKDHQNNIKFVSINTEEESALKDRKSGFNRALRNFQEWNLFCKYAGLLKANHCLFMYFDTCLLPLSWGWNSPCSFSGIYFRPTFHYGDFTHYLPSRKAQIQQWREKITLGRVLRHPQLKTLFCLDPFAVKHINTFHSKARAIHLPDPVQNNHGSQPHSVQLRENLGIHPDRQVFLLFGALDGRKGIYQLLEALLLLPSDLCHKLCLVFVGAANSKEKELIESKVATVCQSQPVQILRHYEFVPEQDVQGYFQLADVVLAPYQRHVGMSGILLLAAATQKPVLSSNYGLMGEIVQQYSLGLTLDSTVPGEIAQGLTRFLLEPPDALCDRAKMRLLAEQNSAKRFASVIFQNLCSNHS